MLTSRRQNPHGALKWTLALYFWLLLWEGALRKWIFPGMSDIIFLIRDPVALLAYVLAIRGRVFPWRPAISAVVIMAALSLVFSFGTETRFMVVLFGLHTDFLHLPLIFIMGTVLTREDVIRYGRWFMICSVPILYLMIRQFNAAPDDILNVGAGGTINGQIRGALGKIRPPGPFSFVSGPVDYFGVAAAYVLYGWLQPKNFNRLLLIVATIATIVAVPVSISRSLLAAELIVVAFGLAVALKDPRRIPAFLGPAVAVAGFLALAADSIYVEAFATRWDESGTTSHSGVTLARMADEFTQPFELAAQTPLLGYGIGLGTVGGAHLNTGQYAFLLAESELARCVMELGPILGFAFIIWRAWLALLLIRQSWGCFLRNADPLAWLIAGSTFFGVIAGQWGPTTNLGFAVFGSGLTLAALNDPRTEPEAEFDAGGEALEEPAG